MVYKLNKKSNKLTAVYLICSLILFFQNDFCVAIDDKTQLLLDEMREFSFNKHKVLMDQNSDIHQLNNVFNDDTEESLDKKNSKSMFESDIVLTSDQAQVIMDEIRNDANNPQNQRKKRQALKNKNYNWLNKTIFYVFNQGNDNWRKLILNAIDGIEKQTCLKFKYKKPYMWIRDYLVFFQGSGCFSNVGRVGFNQKVSIGYGCESKGTIQHEISHALGLWHEQSRYDRYKYIFINFENILSHQVHNFEKRDPSNTENYGLPYDFGSAMHYENKAFTNYYYRNTITTKNPLYQHTMGQRTSLSFKDVKLINYHYCLDVCPKKLLCLNGGFTDSNNCSKCQCPEGYTGKFCDTLAESNSDECKGGEFIVNNEENVLFSPYLIANIKCYYKLKAPESHRIKMSFQQLNFPCYETCTSYVEIKYMNNKVITGPRLCCELIEKPIISEGSEVIIIFKGFPKQNNGYLGFQLKYKLVFPTKINGFKKITTTESIPIFPSITRSTTEVTLIKENILCEWSEWGAFGTCSKPCGGCGIKQRLRACYDEKKKSRFVTEHHINCNIQVCSNFPQLDSNICRTKIYVPCNIKNLLDLQLTKDNVVRRKRFSHIRNNNKNTSLNHNLLYQSTKLNETIFYLMDTLKNQKMLQNPEVILQNDDNHNTTLTGLCELNIKYDCATKLLNLKSTNEKPCCQGFEPNNAGNCIEKIN